ncbi:nucleotidyltransferase domain-containing protein [Actinoplanes sp. Pm04-4]|uniref:Nucleotidyltransferase domain-containing protein n=1 Tax=Paractinoplanes pyxinae TaxID=2997416 RepID=A0ABT4B0F8_9ACTN|nr:nucleotidyltransferase domain-containing protein [Actinoplanes pyxinae]MCY1139974.1 nucleotidyltransferase domain-containing protein [Actinoplanes pyxinae]
MLPQENLIRRVRQLCHDDPRLVAALMYGSFAQGKADEHSDIEFWLFFDAAPDPHAWLAAVGDTLHVVVNEFGAHVVFFPGLIRGEFHFAQANDISSVRSWPALSGPPDRMIVVDRTGELRQALESLPAEPPHPTTPAEVAEVCGRFANWLLLAHHVTARGELLRAADALTHADRHLLWMVRLAENRTDHWLTPSRQAEADLPPNVIQALGKDPATTWALGRRYWQQLAHRHDFPVPEALFHELDAAING